MIPVIQFVLVAALQQAPVKVDTAKARGSVQTPAKAAPTRMDTAKARGPVTTSAPAPPSLQPPQQQQKKSQLVEYSDAYTLRATIHKYSSFTMLPVFGAQYYTGTVLLREREEGVEAPRWVRQAHGPLAVGMAGLFTVNTVTGVLNLWEARKDPEDRVRRTVHALLMMAADAGFVATALRAPPPEPTDHTRHPHRNMAYASMGAAALSYTIMLPFFRKD